MDVVLKKYFWAINLAALAVGGLLVGSTINDYLVARVFGVGDGEIAMPSAIGTDVLPKHTDGESIADQLIARRPFNSDPPPEEAKPPEVNPEPPAETKEEESNDGEMEKSSLDVALIGTLVYPDPDMSIATVKIGGSSKLVRVGSELEGGKAKILQIARRYLLVDEDGKQKYIRLWDNDKGGQGGAAAPGGRPGMPEAGVPPMPPGSNPAAPAAADWKEGVTKVSETEYQISRGMLDEQLQDLSQLGMQARIVPNYRNGKYEGFKLVGVRPNSLYRAIGIRSGDIIKRINGTEINSPNKAIELFEQFKNSNSIQMDIERRGQLQTFQYNVK